MLIFISKKAYRLIFKGIVFFVKGSFFNRIQLIDVIFSVLFKTNEKVLAIRLFLYVSVYLLFGFAC